MAASRPTAVTYLAAAGIGLTVGLLLAPFVQPSEKRRRRRRRASDDGSTGGGGLRSADKAPRVGVGGPTKRASSSSAARPPTPTASGAKGGDGSGATNNKWAWLRVGDEVDVRPKTHSAREPGAERRASSWDPAPSELAAPTDAAAREADDAFGGWRRAQILRVSLDDPSSSSSSSTPTKRSSSAAAAACGGEVVVTWAWPDVQHVIRLDARAGERHTLGGGRGGRGGG